MRIVSARVTLGTKGRFDELYYRFSPRLASRLPAAHKSLILNLGQ